MGVKTITYYEVGDVFDAEGIGPFKVIANFFDEQVANLYASGEDIADKDLTDLQKKERKRGRGNYGFSAKVRKKTLIIADSIEDMFQVKTEQFKQRALAKLSPEEIKALGIKE